MGTTEEATWYRNGLKFRCSQCGNCCTGDPGRVWIDDEELKQIAELLGLSIGEVRLHHTRLYGRRLSLTEFANGDCTFFDAETRRCRVYPVRPRQCRTWPFWNSNLKSKQAWSDTQRDCPGAGTGDFYSLEDVERLAAEIDI